MGLFSKNYRDDEREIRKNIRNKISNIPGLFSGRAASVIEEGLCNPIFEPTKSTIEVDEKIQEVVNNISKLSPDANAVKMYQGLLIEMFTFRNDPTNNCKSKEYREISNKWDLDAKMCGKRVEIEKYSKELKELDENDPFINMNKNNLNKKIENAKSQLKDLIKLAFDGQIYIGLIEQEEHNNYITNNAPSVKDFTKKVDDLRKQRVKIALDNNLKQRAIDEYNAMLDSSDDEAI